MLRNSPIGSVRMRLVLAFAGSVLAAACLVAGMAYLLFRESAEEQMRFELGEIVETIRQHLFFEARELGDFRKAAQESSEEIHFPRAQYAIVDLTFAVIGGARLDAPTMAAVRRFAGTSDYLAPSRHDEWLAVAPLGRPPQGWVVVTASAERVEGELAHLREALAQALLVTLLLAGTVSTAIVLRSLAPIVQLARQARELEGGGDENGTLAERFSGREFSDLAHAFNALLGRLRSTLAHERRFLADASHELRTPLAALRAEIDLARPLAPGGACQEAFGRIDTGATRLERIVEDLFLLARADAGERFERLFEQAYFDDVVREATEAVRPLFVAKSRRLALELADDVEVRGDPGLLARLVRNLVENSSKFGPEGGATTVRLVRRVDDCQLSVVDDGPGIATEEIPHLFDRFYRVRGASSGSGAGLGLAIARQVAELHGGRIEVSSELGRGSAFVVTLPLAKIEA